MIGNFLAHKTGSVGPSERMIRSSLNKKVSFVVASNRVNVLLRLLDMISKATYYRYDIMHIDVYSGRAFIFARFVSRIGFLRSKQIILNLHGGGLAEFHTNNEHLVSKVFHRADTIVSPSKGLIEFFLEKGFSCIYIPNTVDFDSFPFLTNYKNEFKILWVRAFADIYNPKIPILVLQSLLKKFPKTTLTMIGPDKGELNNVKTLISSLGLANRIDLIGPVDNSKLSHYFHSSSVYINTTSFESFGIAVLEAAASGIPIVTNKVGELPLIWSDKEVLFVTDNSVDGFSEKIEEIFIDKNVAMSLRINAYRKSRNYNFENVSLKWQKLLYE